ncbi:MAG TPA: hypothetical protein VJB12_06080 [Candidatus Nanoarchaeia archaeon]|nr:hypothetical protein [Candidatus Nanoarchaeia archaeon]
MRCIKAQSAFEFTLIVAFMTLLFVSLFSVANSALADASEERVMKRAYDIAAMPSSQIVLASSLSDGYYSSFLIPQTVDGEEYDLSLVDGREIVVIYHEFEHVEFLSVNASGTLVFGENTIRKQDGKVYLNS